MMKVSLICFHEILNHIMVQFFSAYNDMFRLVDGKYCLSESLSDSKLKNIVKTELRQLLKENLMPFDALDPHEYVIIDDCAIQDNAFNTVVDANSSKKFKKLLSADYKLKFILKERDINLDLVQFNCVFSDVFSSFMKKTAVKRLLGEEYARNVMFLSHKNADFKLISAILTLHFGNSQCEIMHIINQPKAAVVSLNSIVDNKVRLTRKLLRTDTFQKISAEILQYVQMYFSIIS